MDNLMFFARLGFQEDHANGGLSSGYVKPFDMGGMSMMLRCTLDVQGNVDTVSISADLQATAQANHGDGASLVSEDLKRSASYRLDRLEANMKDQIGILRIKDTATLMISPPKGTSMEVLVRALSHYIDEINNPHLMIEDHLEVARRKGMTPTKPAPKHLRATQTKPSPEFGEIIYNMLRDNRGLKSLSNDDCTSHAKAIATGLQSGRRPSQLLTELMPDLPDVTRTDLVGEMLREMRTLHGRRR